jgi:hypothetical protein
LRGQDCSKVGDQRFSRSARQASNGTHSQPLARNSPERLIGPRPQDQLGNSGAKASGQRTRATVVHDCAAGAETAAKFTALTTLTFSFRGTPLKSLHPAPTNARPPNCSQAAPMIAIVSPGDSTSQQGAPHRNRVRCAHVRAESSDPYRVIRLAFDDG